MNALDDLRKSSLAEGDDSEESESSSPRFSSSDFPGKESIGLRGNFKELGSPISHLALFPGKASFSGNKILHGYKVA